LDAQTIKYVLVCSEVVRLADELKTKNRALDELKNRLYAAERGSKDRDSLQQELLKAHQRIRDSENKVTMLVTENERLKQSKDDLEQQLQMWKKRHDQLSEDQMSKEMISMKIRDQIKEL